ncbi:MAG: PadR family transcriptional regulator [Hyphomicrobiaceae bacterium]|nr:MAG: PadR family transcriptional regulator [Hyphomicrobiaceae bacterium]
MALAEAILVCLTERPMTGYELAKMFDSSVGFFWRARHQQIYRELQQLRADRLVDCEDVIQSGRPNKTIYTITDAGLDRIEVWSRELSERPPVRDNMLVKLYALDRVDLDALATEIANRLAKHRARLAIYERILAKRYSGREMGVRETGWLLGLRVGLMTERGYVSWCKEALEAIASIRNKASRSSRRLSRSARPRREEVR